MSRSLRPVRDQRAERGLATRPADLPQQRTPVGKGHLRAHEGVGGREDGPAATWVRQAGRLLLQHELERAVRSDQPLSVALVDLEPDVADGDGARLAAADLVAVARTLLVRLRGYDPVMRWGGDAFLCVLPEVSREEALRRLHEARRALLTQPARTRIRIGVVQRQERESPAALAARVHRALREQVAG